MVFLCNGQAFNWPLYWFHQPCNSNQYFIQLFYIPAFPPDITLLEISKNLGIEWEQLATYLGFKASEIQCLKIDFPHSTQNRIFQMLVKWRDRQELEVNKKDVLRQALIDIDQIIVADNHLTWQVCMVTQKTESWYHYQNQWPSCCGGAEQSFLRKIDGRFWN